VKFIENFKKTKPTTKHLIFSYLPRKQILKWNNQMYHLELDPLDDVAILRYEIFKETQVKSERQKILNLKAKAGKNV
jgi:hypothetical protein